MLSWPAGLFVPADGAGWSFVGSGYFRGRPRGRLGLVGSTFAAVPLLAFRGLPRFLLGGLAADSEALSGALVSFSFDQRVLLLLLSPSPLSLLLLVRVTIAKVFEEVADVVEALLDVLFFLGLPRFLLTAVGSFFGWMRGLPTGLFGFESFFFFSDSGFRGRPRRRFFG